MGDDVPVLSGAEQQRHFGVDCGDAVRFEAGAWLPGGEHVKKIVAKNVSKRTIKFKYELPTTKYFSMDFPTLITLSPGMQTFLDVAFRPVKAEEYDDFVTFHVQIIEGGVTASSGRFRLPVIARIARLSVEIPRGLDFGFCPTAETTELKFRLRNTGQVDCEYEWSVPGAGEHGRPFSVSPIAGHVAAGGSVELIASFSPVIASVYVSTVACKARSSNPNDPTASLTLSEETMKLSGISKFTHISASETEVNFGDIHVGASNTVRSPTEKEFVLRNRSLVRATFQIVRQEVDCDPVFAFSPTCGVLPPESSMAIRVKYTPISAGTFTCDHFDIVTPSGNRERVVCKGRAVGPLVTMWKKNQEANYVPTSSLNFGDVVVGATLSRVLVLRNESPTEVFFHFDCLGGGVFEFGMASGRIPQLSDVNVTITFSPPRPGNFYRRIFVMLQNQSSKYVDVLGTGYDDSVRPSPFQQAHVDAYHSRIEAGLGHLNPDQLETYWQENGDSLFLRGTIERRRNKTNGDDGAVESPRRHVLTRSGEATLADLDVCHEFFRMPDETENPIVVEAALLDFGNCSVVQSPTKKILRVRNNTHGKVTCFWRVSSTSTNAFQVFPQSLDIIAGGTAEFRVGFQPSTENAYYFAEVEGFVSFKSNRTFRLVNVETFTPPWCVVTKVCGNTFVSATEQFLPKIAFRLPRRGKITFPPCYLGDSVFQTIMLENNSDTPAVFKFVDDPSQIFVCKPSSGYIAAKSFHLVQMRFTPRKVRNYAQTVKCVVNNASETPEVLELAGICALPLLKFCGDEKDTFITGDVRVFVKPTAVGLYSSRLIHIVNDSRVPLVFKWDVPSKLENTFDLSPKLGRLNGREATAISCRFTPQEIKSYRSHFVVAIKSISVSWLSSRTQMASQFQAESAEVLQEATVRVQTKSTAGAVSFDPERTEFETILVSTSSKKTILIANSADCDLKFSLIQELTHLNGSPILKGDCLGSSAPARLEFSETEGIIPARSRKQVVITFVPRIAGAVDFNVVCCTSIVQDEKVDIPSSCTSTSTRICRVSAEASFPTVVIDDIRAPGVPTAIAWRQFMCGEINDYMTATPSMDIPNESTSPHLDGSSPAFAELDNINGTVKHIPLTFYPAPFGSSPQHVHLKLRNPGSLVVDFALRYPKEGNVEIEHWAETGAPSSDEIRTNAILDSKVFQIAPRRARLLPHQSITITLSYHFGSDSYGGIHDVQVMLQVEKGKRLILELQGRTLPRGEPKLFLPYRLFTLSPVMIGEFRRTFSQDGETQGRPPLQQFEVFNRGDTAFRLDITSNAFDKINQQNPSRYPVIRCVTSSEIVAANSSVFVELEFAPVETNPLEVNLILKAHGLMGRAYKEVAMVTVVASGYHPLQVSLAAMRRELALVAKMSGMPPSRQQIAIPGQSVRFQNDLVLFEHVPGYAERTELLILVHEKNSAGPVHFEWVVTHPLVSSGVVRFSPPRGCLSPGEEALVRVTLSTSNTAMVVDHDFQCSITPANAVNSALPLSPKNRDQAAKPNTVKMRESVIVRSTATQLAATARIESAVVARSPTSRNGSLATDVAPAEIGSSNYALFAHIYAHVIPREIYERCYPRDELSGTPLPTVSSEATAQQPCSSLLGVSMETIEQRQRVVFDVFDMLILDVMGGEAVIRAVDDQIIQHELCGTEIDPMVHQCARRSEKCATITSTLVENTVYNVLQELFHEDIEPALACVPRKAVFPKVSTPRRTAAATR